MPRRGKRGSPGGRPDKNDCMSNLCFRGSGKESTVANEDLLLRQMPHSLEGEQAVLGSMLIDEGCVKEVMDKLVPSDFYLRQNREIFETIYTMFTYARPIDGITVCEEMRKAGTYDENTTRSYLAQLMEITPTSANVMEYVWPLCGTKRCCGA